MLVSDALQSIGRQLPLFLIVQARITALFASLFFLRKEYVPARIIIGLSVTLSIFIMITGHLAYTGIQTSDSTFIELLPNLLTQIFLGLITGLTINLFSEIFLGLGQLASMQAGLGFVNFYIPKVGTVTPLTHFYLILSAIIFFELNGHLVLIKMLINSLRVTAHGIHTFDLAGIKQILLFSKIIFSGALMLSLSLTISVMLSNITLAFMTKFAPQLNIFSIGINISLIICYFAAYVSFDLLIEHGSVLLNEIFIVMRQ